jgi:hypothetical protein
VTCHAIHAATSISPLATRNGAPGS